MNKISKLLLSLITLSSILVNTVYALEHEETSVTKLEENVLPLEVNPKEPILVESEELENEESTNGGHGQAPVLPPKVSLDEEISNHGNTEKSENEDKTVEELDELWILDLLANQTNNVGLSQAVTDFINVTESFDFTDELNKEDIGTSIEEVGHRFIYDFKPIESEFENQVIYTYHYFETEGTDEETPVAFLNFHFVNDALSAVSFHFAEPDLENKLSEEEISDLSGADVIVQDILELNPNVIGLVYKNKGEAYDALIIPSGEEANVTLNFIEVIGTQVNIAESVSYANEDMLDLINRYISEK